MAYPTCQKYWQGKPKYWWARGGKSDGRFSIITVCPETLIAMDVSQLLGSRARAVPTPKVYAYAYAYGRILVYSPDTGSV